MQPINLEMKRDSCDAIIFPKWQLSQSSLPRKVDPSTYDDVLQNTLVISSVERAHHASLFECRAINNNVTDPPT